MFSSCLPMILSMVIFIVAINAFNAYAQYANVENYNTLVGAYNESILSYSADLDEDSATLEITDDGTLIYVKDGAEDKFIYYTVPYQANYAENDYAYVKNGEKTYKVDSAKALSNAEINAFVAAQKESGKTEEDAIYKYFEDKAQTAVVTAYESDVYGNTKFLWIKNIWVTDASYKNPVLDYDSFNSEIKREEFRVGDEKIELDELNTTVYSRDTYNLITAKLDTQKDQANGYFILIVLSIGTILLQQFVSMRSQKEQQKYSSVDGQGASQQKMMLVIMTVMFAVFSFLYSSAFSIYMITSNVMSLLSTLIINKAVDMSANRKETAAESAKLSGRAARTAGVSVKNAEKKDKKSKKDK